MKFKFKLCSSKVYQDEKNTTYLDPVEVDSLDSFKEVIKHDYVCAVYKNNYRSKDTFLYSDCIPFDIDNDHSNNPADWLTPEDVSKFFSNVPMLIHYSRNHLKPKGNKTARPRFHFFMPIEPIRNHKEYSDLKERIYAIYPYVDKKALDSARFFFGTSEPNVEYIDGTRTLTKFLKEYDDEEAFSNLDARAIWHL